jgi:hypothetical protein
MRNLADVVEIKKGEDMKWKLRRAKTGGQNKCASRRKAGASCGTTVVRESGYIADWYATLGKTSTNTTSIISRDVLN